MDIELVPLMMVVGGSVLLYGAIKNRNPIDVVKMALTGKPLTAARQLNTVGSGDATDGGPGGDIPVGTPKANVDSLGVAPVVNDILAKLGIDGNTVVIPYTGHPIGSKATDPDKPGFMGGIAGRNSSYPPGDSRYVVNSTGGRGARSTGGTF